MNEEPPSAEKIRDFIREVANLTPSVGCLVELKQFKTATGRPIVYTLLKQRGEDITFFDGDKVWDTTLEAVNIFGHPVKIGWALNEILVQSDDNEIAMHTLDVMEHWSSCGSMDHSLQHIFFEFIDRPDEVNETKAAFELFSYLISAWEKKEKRGQ